MPKIGPNRFRIAVQIGALVCFAAPMAAEPETAGDFSVISSIPYSDEDAALTMDLYLPISDETAIPCILVIQGGGFAAQTGQRFKPFAEYLAKGGFAAALIAYRGRPDHEYADTVRDTKAAVRFLRESAVKYRIDPGRIGAMGRSAGGTLVALLAASGSESAFETDSGKSQQSSAIQAGVAFCGVFDFISRFTDQRQIDLQPGLETKARTNGEWIGSAFSIGHADWLNASAINHVDKDDPPMLFLHCKDDATVPWIQSQIMHEALLGAGASSSIVYYESGGHGFRDLGDAPLEEMVRFFEAQLK